LTVLPGRVSVVDLYRYNTPLSFAVGLDGTVSNDPSLEGIFTGIGTRTLTIHGVSVTVDARALSLADMVVDSQIITKTQQPYTLTVLPGGNTIADPTGSGEHVSFTIKTDGTVDYDTALEGILTGRGTNTLTVHGVAVTIDAHALSYRALYVDNVAYTSLSQ